MAFLLVKKRRMTRRRNREAREKREKRQRKPSRPIKSTCTCCGFRIKIFVINHAKRVYSLKQQATGGALKAKQTRANAPEEPPEGVRGGARARTACAAPTCRNTVGGPSELALQEGRRGVMMITRRITRSQAQGTGGFIRAGETLLRTWPFNGWEEGERPAGAARRRRSSANRYLGLSHLIFTSQSRFCLKPTWLIEPVGKHGSPELTVPTRGHSISGL